MNVFTDDLVAANRILYHLHVIDAFGHVSGRDPDDPATFVLARHVAPKLVTAADLMRFRCADGSVAGNDTRKSYTELWIHAAIYAARPDVWGIVHSHSHGVIPFGITQRPLRPVWAVSSFLGQGVAHFDTRPLFGDTDLLIRNAAMGRALAQALGQGPVVLMRGHGSTTVGASVREAVYRAYYTEQNAHLQTVAEAMGPVEFLSPGEAAHGDARKEPSYRRVWELWLDEIGSGQRS